MPRGGALQELAGAVAPPACARAAKRVAVWPRYWMQARACRAGYQRFGGRYPRKVLFVAGLPKSGTTWLERMIASYPGFHQLLIPDVAAYELATGGSHDYQLPEDMFERFERMLVLTKMHIDGSPHNVRLLRSAGVPHVILFRDLRDVAISHYHYVRNTPWHPEHPIYRTLDQNEGLEAFARRTLDAYAEWGRSWAANRDPAQSLILRYEEMLEGPHGTLARVARLFQLDDAPETIKSIVEAHSFKRMSGGREAGQSSDRAFVRKGVAGDWANQFTPGLRDLYKQKIGDLLIEFGFETSYDW